MAGRSLKRIFIVDDDPDIRKMLSLILRSAEYEVVGQASDGIDILKKLLIATPSVVLLDINMPGTSGLDVLEEILKTYSHIKVVMISGSSSSDDVKTAITRGASGYIVKPFNTGQVVQNIERAIASAKAESKARKSIS